MHLVWVSWHFWNGTRPLRSHLTSHIQSVQRLKAIACNPTLQRGAAVTVPKLSTSLDGSTFCPRGVLLLRLGMPSRYPSLEVWASSHTFVWPPTHSIAAGLKPVALSLNGLFICTGAARVQESCAFGLPSFIGVPTHGQRAGSSIALSRRVSAPTG